METPASVRHRATGPTGPIVSAGLTGRSGAAGPAGTAGPGPGAEPRLWLVVPAGAADPLGALPAARAGVLRARYTATGTERLTGVTVALLVRRPR
ncbi:hypothetical protein [Streptomyces roseoviridis]|uniref:Uncharacterized protein n=1 Tax=Streptomyces roseoviridis TaxID=67361 RepID=A0ABV5QGW5_9ACTN